MINLEARLAYKSVLNTRHLHPETVATTIAVARSARALDDGHAAIYARFQGPETTASYGHYNQSAVQTVIT